MPRPTGEGDCIDWYPCGRVRALALDPLASPSTLYVGTDAITSADEEGWLTYTSGDVFKSTDGGESWAHAGLAWKTWWIDRWIDGHQVAAVAVDPRTVPRVLYAGTGGGPTGASSYDVFKSSDGGASWEGTGLRRPVVFFVIDPVTPTILYAGVRYQVNYQPRQGVFKSTDAGSSWTFLSALSEDVFALAIDRAVPTTLYAETAGGVRKSIDAGASWSSNTLGLPVTSLAIDSVNRSTLYAGTWNGVYKSTDGGLSWHPTALAARPSLSGLSVSPASVREQSTSAGTVTLSAAAPSGGAAVSLSSSNPAVAAVPASVTVPAGAMSAAFILSAGMASTATMVTISASFDGVIKSADVTVNPAASLASLTLSPSSVTAGVTSTGTVTVTSPAPVAGALITLSSSNPALAGVPQSVTLPAGTMSGTFPVSTVACSAGAATISATYAEVMRSAGFSVTVGATDSVGIRRAEYMARQQLLRVEATSSSSGAAALTVFVASSGQPIGALSRASDGRYEGRFTWPANPQAISVRSSLCGSATKTVTLK